MKQFHPYHLVDISPWPLYGSLGALIMATGGAMYLHSYKLGGKVVLLGLLIVLLVMYYWWKDVVREGTYGGHHTLAVQKGLKLGMILFIVSEVFFFLGFFWAFFHASLAPSVELGCLWPPKGIEALNPQEIPLLNTLILLSSGASVTWSHHAMINGDRKNTINGLIITIILASIFTALQGYEYYEAAFTISDGVYGSTFYGATGLHGLHVIIGTIFLTVCLFRVYKHHFTRHHHIGFISASWYWHFVDVVWLFLYASIYYWGYY